MHRRTVRTTLVLSTIAALAITFVPAASAAKKNHAPVAKADAASVAEGGSVAIKLLANDRDADRNKLHVVKPLTTGLHGSVKISSAGVATYRSGAFFEHLRAGAHATDTFSYVASDGKASSKRVKVTVTVTGANDAPTAVHVIGQVSVAENTPDTTVGTLAATDIDTGDALTWSVVASGADDSSHFTIGAGNTLHATAFDFESQAVAHVTVRAADGHAPPVSLAVVVTITNVNEAPTGLHLSASTIAENGIDGAEVATLTRDDIDAGDTASYSFNVGIGDDDNGAFSIAGDKLVLTHAADFESQDTYHLRLQVTDTAGLHFIHAITLAVDDVNEAPVIEWADLSGSASEGAVAGTDLSEIAAPDPDGDSVSVTLVAGAGSTDNAHATLTFNPLFGHWFVSLDTALDFEAKPAWHIRVQATDGHGGISEHALTLTVLDVNEAPTDIHLSASTVAENGAAGAEVATITSDDVDAGDTATYALDAGVGGEDNAAFSVTGNKLALTNPADFEVQSSYHVRLTVSDQGGFSTSVSFVVTVTDINDVPAGLALSHSGITELFPAGRSVGDLSAVDQDGDTLSYSLVTGPGDDQNDQFQVVGTQLQSAVELSSSDGLDRHVRVQVSDGHGGSQVRQLIINVEIAGAASMQFAPTATFTEGDAPVALDANAWIDSHVGVDQVKLEVSGWHSGDVLAVPASPVFDVVDDGMGTLTITPDVGNPNMLFWRDELRAVTFANSSEAPESNDRTVVITAIDHDLATSTATETVHVNPVNDPPTVTNEASLDEIYVAPGSDIVFGPTTMRTFSVSDVDDSCITEQVSVTGAHVGTFDDPLGAGGPNAPGFILGGTCGQAANLFNNLTYHAPAEVGDSVIRFNDEDSSGASGFLLVTVHVVAPSTTGQADLNYTENDPASVVSGSTLVWSPHSNIVQATVQISSGYHGGDTLAIPAGALDGGISSATWDAASQTMTLTGTAAPINYQEALRAMTYVSPSDNPTDETRVLTWTLTDLNGATGTSTSNINVQSVDDAPVVTWDGTNPLNIDDAMVGLSPWFNQYHGTRFHVTDAEGDCANVVMTATNGRFDVGTYGVFSATTWTSGGFSCDAIENFVLGGPFGGNAIQFHTDDTNPTFTLKVNDYGGNSGSFTVIMLGD